MKNSILITLLFLTAFTSCGSDDELSQEEESQNLSEMLSEIRSLAQSVSCDNPEDWTFTPFGNKACGGPVGFIAYSINIDVDLFIEKVAAHARKQSEFNDKWGIVSDCSVPAAPSGIICVDGIAVFED